MVLNATKDTFVPGMTKEAICNVYGSHYAVCKDWNGCCYPKEEVVFNDTIVFFCKCHPFNENYEDHTYDVICADGLIHLDEEQFYRYFVAIYGDHIWREKYF